MLEPKHDRRVFKSLQYMMGTKCMQVRRRVRYGGDLSGLSQFCRYGLNHAASHIFRNVDLVTPGHLCGQLFEIVIRVTGDGWMLQMGLVLLGAFNQAHYRAEDANSRGRDRAARLEDRHYLGKNERCAA